MLLAIGKPTKNFKIDISGCSLGVNICLAQKFRGLLRSGKCFKEHYLTFTPKFGRLQMYEQLVDKFLHCTRLSSSSNVTKQSSARSYAIYIHEKYEKGNMTASMFIRNDVRTTTFEIHHPLNCAIKKDCLSRVYTHLTGDVDRAPSQATQTCWQAVRDNTCDIRIRVIICRAISRCNAVNLIHVRTIKHICTNRDSSRNPKTLLRSRDNNLRWREKHLDRK